MPVTVTRKAECWENPLAFTNDPITINANWQNLETIKSTTAFEVTNSLEEGDDCAAPTFALTANDQGEALSDDLAAVVSLTAENEITVNQLKFK